MNVSDNVCPNSLTLLSVFQQRDSHNKSFRLTGARGKKKIVADKTSPGGSYSYRRHVSSPERRLFTYRCPRTYPCKRLRFVLVRAPTRQDASIVLGKRDVDRRCSHRTILPERILVARYFPAVYIVKLNPKKKGAHTWATADSMHGSLRGNVSTNPLNTEEDIATMTNDQFTSSAGILAATIGVTFVGPRNLPQ